MKKLLEEVLFFAITSGNEKLADQTVVHANRNVIIISIDRSLIVKVMQRE